MVLRDHARTLFPKQIKIEMLARMAADAIMLNAALIIALVLRFAWQFGVDGEALDTRRMFRSYVGGYEMSFWWFTLLALTIFYLSGFYTYGRRYTSRYKVLVILQAVTLSYLILGFAAFFVPSRVDLPRSVIIWAWALTVVFLMTARTWVRLWTKVERAERRLRVSSNPDAGTPRNILVIGGAGYIGSALLPKLLDAGYNVRLLDLMLYGPDPIRQVLNHPRLEVRQADFRQVDVVVEAMAEQDAVIHLGAIVGDPACALDEELTIQVNLMATRMIGEVAKGCGVTRFIFASTCSVYGASDEWLDEHSTLNPVSLYARSKIASEKVLLKLASERFAPTILRFGTIYGFSGRMRFDLVVNVLTARAMFEGRIPVHGGEQWRPFLHVDDAALAIYQALRAPHGVVQNQIFNVGSNEQNYTITQVGTAIQRLVPNAQVIQSGADTDRRNYRVKFSKIERELKFSPRWTLDAGILQVVRAIEQGAVKDYQDAQYSNVRFLSEEGPQRLTRQEREWAHTLINA